MVSDLRKPTVQRPAFADFRFTYDDSLQSYKGVMIDKHMDPLTHHLIVLKQQNAPQEEGYALLMNSALRDM